MTFVSNRQQATSCQLPIRTSFLNGQLEQKSVMLGMVGLGMVGFG